MKNLTVTSKRNGIVFASNPSGGVKVSLHGMRKSDYQKIRKGQKISPK